MLAVHIMVSRARNVPQCQPENAAVDFVIPGSFGCALVIAEDSSIVDLEYLPQFLFCFSFIDGDIVFDRPRPHWLRPSTKCGDLVLRTVRTDWTRISTALKRACLDCRRYDPVSIADILELLIQVCNVQRKLP